MIWSFTTRSTASDNIVFSTNEKHLRSFELLRDLLLSVELRFVCWWDGRANQFTVHASKLIAILYTEWFTVEIGNSKAESRYSRRQYGCTFKWVTRNSLISLSMLHWNYFPSLPVISKLTVFILWSLKSLRLRVVCSVNYFAMFC